MNINENNKQKMIETIEKESPDFVKMVLFLLNRLNF